MSFALARILAFGSAGFSVGVAAILLADSGDWKVAAAYALLAAFSAALSRAEARRVRRARSRRRAARRLAQSLPGGSVVPRGFVLDLTVAENWMPTLSSGQILDLYERGELTPGDEA